jgi:hypothetical protein
VSVCSAPRLPAAAPASKPKLGPLLGAIDAFLEADRTAPVKQRHTAKRIFERLRDEHGFSVGYTVVKDHGRLSRARGRGEVCPVQLHDPCQSASKRDPLSARKKDPSRSADRRALVCAPEP